MFRRLRLATGHWKNCGPQLACNILLSRFVLMVDQATKRRATQTHMDAISEQSGPVYGVRLLETLPLGKGGMLQAMPSKSDLKQVQRINARTVAGFEVLTEHYREQCNEVARLKDLIRQVIAGKWSLTALQESIGDL